jgi:integration host factor subunit alpha
MAVTRANLAEAVYQATGLSRGECRDLVDATIDEIIAALVSGRKVGITGFGSFILRHIRERMGRNPKTGVPAKVPARRMVVFRPSRKVKAKCAEAV